MSKNYIGVMNAGKKFFGVDGETTTGEVFPPGSYSYHQNQQGQWWLEKIELNSDNILELPSPEFQFVVNQFSKFLSPEVKQKFKDLGFLYKRSTLLHGLWGTGKSVITNRIAKEVVTKHNGICLYLQDPYQASKIFSTLDDLQPETPVAVIFEEIDEIVRKYEDMLLLLLDGAVQKNNVIFLATTNHISKIPKRILRPGRFGLVVKVHYPNKEARQMYFEHKLGKQHSRIAEYVSASEGLSVDELKEIVLSCEIFENSLKDTIKRIMDTREVNTTEVDEEYDGDDEEKEDEDFLTDIKSHSSKIMNEIRYMANPLAKSPNGALFSGK